ncbi:MAG: dTDP-4-dehydrorhamnose 3,5-epimerase [Oligoflexia bacterium]|nr:dTDP-4-dehydrorhamnose 3,5-epimerase [Oligoflexia bacterium]
MKVSNLELEGLKLIELKVFSDSRGYFIERFNSEKFKEHGVPYNFVQDNHSFSKAGVLRGLHFQFEPVQEKVVGVTRGKIWDVVVDIRKNSPTFLKHIGIELGAENGRLLYIPAGFAHGFCVMGSEPADVLYKVDTVYNPKGEAGILWNAPELGIKWPVDNPIISDRDQKLMTISEFKQKNL